MSAPNNIGAVKREDGFFDIVDLASGARVIRFPSDERPMRLEFGHSVTYQSALTSSYGHPDGIVFDGEQVAKLGIRIVERPIIEQKKPSIESYSL